MVEPDLPNGDAPASHRKAILRRWLFGLFGAVLFAAALGAGLWWMLIGMHYVSTDDAYVNVSSAQVTPLTSGTVSEVLVDNAEAVKGGDVLLRIDPADAQLQCDQAVAAYNLILRKVQAYFTAPPARQADYNRAKFEYEQRLKLKGTGSISAAELATYEAAYENAKAALGAAEAMTQNTDILHHPEVLSAKAARDTAMLNLDRTVVRAPVDGIVAQRSIQVGQRVQAGNPVMMIVPVAQVYVDANFKEDQLAKVHPGQSAVLTSDLYGSSVRFHGRVVGLSGGTGSAFAIIPAQNATGNWIKVVQRIPVRILLDPDELKAHPLRVGLSISATIDVSE